MQICPYCRTNGGTCEMHPAPRVALPAQDDMPVMGAPLSPPATPPHPANRRATARQRAPAVPRGRPCVWTEARIIACVQAWTQQHGRPPGYEDLRTDRTLPGKDTVWKHFGSIRHLWQAAGYADAVPAPTVTSVWTAPPRPAPRTLVEILPPAPVEPLGGSPEHPARKFWWDLATAQPVREDE